MFEDKKNYPFSAVLAYVLGVASINTLLPDIENLLNKFYNLIISDNNLEERLNKLLIRGVSLILNKEEDDIVSEFVARYVLYYIPYLYLV